MNPRASKLVRTLLESDPDAPDASYLKHLPDQTDAARNFVLAQVDSQINSMEDEAGVHRKYAAILRGAIAQFGRPQGEDYGDIFRTGMYEISSRHVGIQFMPSDEAAEIYGDLLVGVLIDTEAAGEYPGGPATVTEIRPDPEAPDIVFQVSNPAYEDGEIGVIDHENIEFL